MERPHSIFGQTAATVAPATQVQPADILNEQDHALVPVAPVTVKATVIAPKAVSEDQILQLGNDAGKTIATISGRILEVHKGSSQGEMGDKLDALIKEAKGLSADNFSKQGLVKGIVNKIMNVKYDIQSQFTSAKGKVDMLITELEQERKKQVEVEHNIEDLIKGNAQYCSSIISDMETGKQMLETIADEIAKFPDAQNLSIEDNRAYNDAKNRYDLLEKKLVDLQSFKVLSINMDPKLNAMKASGNSLLQTFDMIVGQMVPAFMLNFADYLNAKDQERAEQLSNTAIDAFDAVIKASGEQAAKNLENIGKLKNRQLVNVDTVRQQHEQVVAGLNNLRAIEEQARQDRAKTIVELQDIEQKSIAAFSRK